MSNEPVSQISPERLAELLVEVNDEMERAVADAEYDQNPQLAIDAVGEFDLSEMRSILTELQSRRSTHEGEAVAWRKEEPSMPPFHKYIDAAPGESGWEPLYLHPSSSIEGVKVKGLAWTERNPIRKNGDLKSDSIVGRYEIGLIGGRVMVFLRLVRKGDAEDIDIGSFDTFEAAKAAAQADFERRILSSLDLSPKPLEITEGRVQIIEQSDTPTGATALTLSLDGQEACVIVRFTASLKEGV